MIGTNNGEAYIVTVIFFFVQSSIAQVFSISIDKSNILYLEFDNPLTLAVENTDCSLLIVKTDNGVITGANGHYVYRPEFLGKVKVTISKKVNGKLKVIGSQAFQVQSFFNASNVVFKIGPCGDDCKIDKAILVAQHYVRAEVINSDFSAALSVNSFDVRFVSNNDNNLIHNIGGKISEELNARFDSLSDNAILVFQHIYVNKPNGANMELYPIKISVSEKFSTQ